MQNAVAFTNNDVITIAWSYGRRPSGCLGFALYRIDSTGRETPLPSHAVFRGLTIEPGQTTEEFPIQKFYWKDPYARLVAEKMGHRTFRYRVTPLGGRPGHLTPMPQLPSIITNEVEISPMISGKVSAYFNRGQNDESSHNSTGGICTGCHAHSGGFAATYLTRAGAGRAILSFLAGAAVAAGAYFLLVDHLFRDATVMMGDAVSAGEHGVRCQSGLTATPARCHSQPAAQSTPFVD